MALVPLSHRMAICVMLPRLPTRPSSSREWVVMLLGERVAPDRASLRLASASSRGLGRRDERGGPESELAAAPADDGYSRLSFALRCRQCPDDLAGIGVQSQGRVAVEVRQVGPAEHELRRR